MAVIGDVMLDVYVYGDSHRISPEAPVPVVSVERELDCLGGASNVARNLKDLGAEPILIGVVGNDATASRVRHALRQANITDEYLTVDAGRITGIKTRIIARGQQVVRIDRESTNPIESATAGAIKSALASIAKTIVAVIFSDYGKGVVLPSRLPEWLAAAPGVFSCVDPFPPHAYAYKGINAVTPNKDEARRMLSEEGAHVAEGERLGSGLQRQLGVDEVYVTLGKEGMVFCGTDGIPIRYPTRPRQVFDVSGAGDTVIAMIAALRGLGIAPAVACQLANRAAGLVVEKVGTATVTPAEIIADAARSD